MFRLHNAMVSQLQPESLQVSYVSDEFLKAAYSNLEKLYDANYKPKNGFYAFLAKQKRFVLAFLEDGILEIIVYSGYVIHYALVYNFNENDISYATGIGDSITAELYLQTALQTYAIIAFKECATLKTKTLKPKTKIKQHHCKYQNLSPFDIDLCDLNWYTNSLQSHPFVVRGHWRMQRFGLGRQKTKLTYIDTFMKQGYTKGAYKESHK